MHIEIGSRSRRRQNVITAYAHCDDDITATPEEIVAGVDVSGVSACRRAVQSDLILRSSTNDGTTERLSKRTHKQG